MEAWRTVSIADIDTSLCVSACDQSGDVLFTTRNVRNPKNHLQMNRGYREHTVQKNECMIFPYPGLKTTKTFTMDNCVSPLSICFCVKDKHESADGYGVYRMVHRANVQPGVRFVDSVKPCDMVIEFLDGVLRDTVSTFIISRADRA